ncbi:MAG: GldM family protein, partial [Bacteroidales bacterium]
MNTMKYILISTISLSIFYLIYVLIFRKEGNFRQMRFFLLGSLVMALLIPLSNYSINLNFSIKRDNDKTAGIESEENQENTLISDEYKMNELAQITSSGSKNFKINWLELLKGLYIFIALGLLARILVQIVIMVQQYFVSDKISSGNYIYVYNSRFKNTFSFFNLIFINSDNFADNDSKEIILHEKIHASQFHSFDIIAIELLSAVMWFNPVVWLMRKEIQLVHEYLADEGALSTGIDKLRYQALLINQITEERLICLSSSFNHSLIKKRMIMITKSNFNSKTKLKILALIPVAALIFLGVACVNEKNKTNTVTAVAPVKMNVLYIGVDNPVKIAASGYRSSKLEASIDNGTISGSNGEYIVRPEKPGKAMITVSIKGKTIQQSQFRVKTVPDPVAAIKTSNGYFFGGEITKDELLAADG